MTWIYDYTRTPQNGCVAPVGHREESVVSACSLVLALKLDSQLCWWNPGAPALQRILLKGSSLSLQSTWVDEDGISIVVSFAAV